MFRKFKSNIYSVCLETAALSLRVFVRIICQQNSARGRPADRARIISDEVRLVYFPGLWYVELPTRHSVYCTFVTTSSQDGLSDRL